MMIADRSCFMVNGFGERQNYFHETKIRQRESPF